MEFVSINDAIEARKMLLEGDVYDYENTEPAFVGEPSARLEVERAWCGCLGCKEQRGRKAAA